MSSSEFKKPDKRPLKDYLIEHVAEEMSMPVNVVEAVVMDQFRGITKALQTCNSVEMTGFGKWVFLDKRARKVLSALEEMSSKMEQGSEKDNLNRDIELLKKKVNQ